MNVTPNEYPSWAPRDPASAISHLVGFILAVIGTIFLVIKGNYANGLLYATVFAIFGVTMILLYLARVTPVPGTALWSFLRKA